jgi:hypothetical protein
MRAVLPEALVDLDLGEVFHDADLSDRVKAVGLYQPKVLPWLTRAAQAWLPPEHGGLLVDDRRIELSRDDADQLLSAVKNAIAEGKDHVDFNGERIPSTGETLGALEHVVREYEPITAPVEEAQGANEERPPDSAPGQKVLLIHENLDALEYQTRDITRGTFPREVTSRLRTTLLVHQQEALDVLRDHYEAGRAGALLADDMGLGKTLTALAFLAWLKTLQDDELVRARPFLLVAPTGLLRTWARESETHLAGRALGFRLDAHGPALRSLRVAATTKELASGLPVLDVDKLQQADWVLTTYETLRDYQHSFGRVSWGCVVFDEAQKIKNPGVAMTDAAKAMNATFRLALTGTPVENRLSDLWSIADAVHPGRLGALKEFVATYEGEGETTAAALRGLHGELTTPPPFMIRRTKEGRLDGLPPREVHVIREPMPDPQARAYEEAVRQARAPAGSFLATLHRLRQVSLHPHEPSPSADDEGFIACSARWRVLFRCLDRIRDAGEKALVFLDDLDAQGILAGMVQRRYRLERSPLIISGEVAGSKRQARVDDFQARSGFDLMVLSPRAAGVGLTITAANHVVHLSRWWNPAVEDQCNDRVYRIGQERGVHVYLPCAVHPIYGDASFDVKLHELLDRKRSRSREVLSPPQVTDREVEGLFRAVCNPDAAGDGQPTASATRGLRQDAAAPPPTKPPSRVAAKLHPLVAESRSRGSLEQPEIVRERLLDSPVSAPAAPTAPLASAVAATNGDSAVPVSLALRFSRSGVLVTRAPDPTERETCVRAITFLLARGGMAAAPAFAAEMNRMPRSVAGLVSKIQEVLNVDGYEVIRFDAPSMQVRLDTAKLSALFEIGS